MAAATPPLCDFGWPAPTFELPGVDGRRHALSDLVGPSGVVVMFICNHCPYVTSAVDRLVAAAAEMGRFGVTSVAICSNDATRYPEDGFEPMKAFAAAHGFGFPYLHDADQSVARAYDAVCTPDFFGFDADLKLQYRGQLDAGRPGRPPAAGASSDLVEAMRLVAETRRGPDVQTPSMGCSIKWIAA